MPRSKKEQTRIRVRRYRERKSVTSDSVTSKSVTDTISISDIKTILPQDIISYIENVGSRYGLTEQRFRRAYEYQVWHNENFISGVHGDLSEATK